MSKSKHFDKVVYDYLFNRLYIIQMSSKGVTSIYRTLRNREKNFQQKTYTNHGIEDPKMTPNIKKKLHKTFPFLQIITNTQWKRQWGVTKNRLESKINLNRDVVWFVRTRGGGVSTQNRGHLSRSQAWIFGKLAQTFPKPTYIVTDVMVPIKDKTQIIFADDASYSGAQLFTEMLSLGSVLYGLKEKYNRQISVDIYLTIPFIHINAWKGVKEAINEIITKYSSGTISSTSRKIIGENTIFKMNVYALGRIIHDTYKTNPIFILEHKVADSGSLGPISDKIRKIYDPSPIYKRDTVVYIPRRFISRDNREFIVGRPSRKIVCGQAKTSKIPKELIDFEKYTQTMNFFDTKGLPQKRQLQDATRSLRILWTKGDFQKAEKQLKSFDSGAYGNKRNYGDIQDLENLLIRWPKTKVPTFEVFRIWGVQLIKQCMDDL